MQARVETAAAWPSASPRHRGGVTISVAPDWRAPHDEPRGIDPTPERTFTSCMVTGHRPQHLTADEMAWSQVALHTAAWRLRSRYGMQEGISGFAIGSDQWWAMAVLATGAHLAAYIPFLDQPRRWSVTERALWSELRQRAHREVLVAGPENPGYNVRMLHARNDAMLRDTAAAGGLVVALFKPGTTGGTASAVERAQSSNQPMLLLDPASRSVTRHGW